MKAVVVYESVYGNSRAIAEAIAAGLGTRALPVGEAAEAAAHADLLIVGGPTHMHGLATSRSRQMAIAAAHEDGGTGVDEHAGDEPGLRAWLRELAPADGRKAAAFDTRLDRSPWISGTAARGIGRRLRSRGYDVVGIESFLVDDAEGPLADGELDRARAWGMRLAEAQPAATTA